MVSGSDERYRIADDVGTGGEVNRILSAAHVETRFASWFRRGWALVLDYAIVLSVPVALLSIGDYTLTEQAITLGLWTIVAGGVYFTLLHGGARGQTVGKRLLAIQVRRRSRDGHVEGVAGGPLGYGRALLRWLGVLLFGAFPALLLTVLDYLWPLWDSENQALHDKIAGSVVVVIRRDRDGQ